MRRKTKKRGDEMQDKKKWRDERQDTRCEIKKNGS